MRSVASKIPSFIQTIKWLTHEGPTSSKHKSWSHPIATFLIHYTITTISVLAIHDWLLLIFPSIPVSYPPTKFQTLTSNFLILYFTWIVLYRLYTSRNVTNTNKNYDKYSNNRKGIDQSNIFKDKTTNSRIFQKATIYELTWLCNVTLFMGCIGLRTGRILVVSGHLVAVSIDQVLWYVDLIGWALCGFKKFPVGVAKYITWPETTWSTRISSTHHLWTIPILLHAIGCCQFTVASYFFSIIVVVLNVTLSRWLTPICIDLPPSSKVTKLSEQRITPLHNKKYLNVNLSHEVWKDVEFSFLEIRHDDPSWAVYLFRLLWRWQLFNGIVFFFVLQPLCRCSR